MGRTTTEIGCVHTHRTLSRAPQSAKTTQNTRNRQACTTRHMARTVLATMPSHPREHQLPWAGSAIFVGKSSGRETAAICFSHSRPRRDKTRILLLLSRCSCVEANQPRHNPHAKHTMGHVYRKRENTWHVAFCVLAGETMCLALSFVVLPAVLGTTSARSSSVMRPMSLPPASISKNTWKAPPHPGPMR